MNKRRIIALILSTLAIATGSVAVFGARSTILFNDSRLIAPSYTDITLDDDGFVWAGTDNGLLRYDGANIKSYRHDTNDSTTISDNRILKLFNDNDRRLWVGTANGLNLYDPADESFTTIRLPELNFGGYVREICQLQSGEIVFLVSGVGMYVIDETQGRPAAVRYMHDMDRRNLYNALAEDSRGNLLIGCHDGSIHIIAPNGQWTTHQPADTYIRQILRTPQGDMIAMTPDRVWRRKAGDDEFVAVTQTVNVPIDITSAMTADDGNTYLSTNGQGFWTIDAGSNVMRPYREFYNPQFDCDRSHINALTQDDAGNVWFGVPYTGLVMAPVKSLPFTYVNASAFYPDYLGGKSVVGVDSRGRILAGIQDHGLTVIQSSPKISIKTPGNVNSILTARDGRTYLGIENNGLYELRLPEQTVRPLYTVSGHHPVTAIVEDRDGRLYVGLHGMGLLRYNPKTGGHEWISESTERNTHVWMTTLMCDRDNRLWIGMYGGLSCYDIDKGEFIDLGDIRREATHGTPTSMGQDADGMIWIGTTSRLFRVDPSDFTFRSYSMADGLSDNAVTAIIPDAAGNVWFGTHDGIDHYNVADSTFTSYRGGLGLGDSGYGSAAANGDGTYLVFGGEKGITAFKPGDVHTARVTSPVTITGVQINGTDITRDTRNNGRPVIELRGDTAITRINMTHDENLLRLNLSTMDYANVGNTVIQWRIKGVTDHWVTMEPGQGDIIIPHLTPGNHDLELRAMGNQIESEVTTIKLHVSPPWYLTNVAKIIWLLVFIALLVELYIIFKKRAAEKNNEEKIKFFMNISHEIRSPMTLILGPLENLLKKDHDPDTMASLTAMHRNANRILSLVNQLLDLRKIDKGKMTLSCSQVELIGFVDELVGIFRPKAGEKNLTMEFENRTGGDGLDVWIDSRNFDKVLVNLLTNAIKYTPDGGDIRVAVTRGHNDILNDYAEITVTDTGVGLDEKNIGKIFERFYQAKNAGAVQGFGIGLDLCRSMVELHHGTIEAANRTDTRGSRFTVRIPLGRAHLDDSQIADTSTARRAADATLVPAISAVITDDDDSPARAQRKKSGQTILVVDDDAEIRRYVATSLGALYNTVTAANGNEAMKILLNKNIDLIISDIIMPEMDGIALLKAIKGNMTTNHIPVILLSSKYEVKDRMEGWSKGADGYIGKPFKMDELISMAENLIDNRLRLRGKFSGVQEQTATIDAPDVKGNDRKLVERITAIINENIESQDLNVGRLSEEVGISRAHLHRKMKELLGMTASEFIRNVRLRRACELLKNRDIDITQITYLVGFASQPHFSTAFKRFTGFTPTEYRAQMLKGEGQ